MFFFKAVLVNKNYNEFVTFYGEEWKKGGGNRSGGYTVEKEKGQLGGLP